MLRAKCRFTAGETEMSVFQYFKNKYKIPLRYPLLPCIQIGQPKRQTYLPMEVLFFMVLLLFFPFYISYMIK